MRSLILGKLSGVDGWRAQSPRSLQCRIVTDDVYCGEPRFWSRHSIGNNARAFPVKQWKKRSITVLSITIYINTNSASRHQYLGEHRIDRAWWPTETSRKLFTNKLIRAHFPPAIETCTSASQGFKHLELTCRFDYAPAGSTTSSIAELIGQSSAAYCLSFTPHPHPRQSTTRTGGATPVLATNPRLTISI